MSGAGALLERVVEAGGRLLRVDRLPAPGGAGAGRSEVLRLTFDVAVVELRESAGRLEAEAAGGEPGPGFVDANEDEPWWALLGSPLVRVGAETGGAELRVQFRADDENPRRVVLASAAGGIAWRIDAPH